MNKIEDICHRYNSLKGSRGNSATVIRDTED